MKLDVPWNFSYIRIGWHWSCLWWADRLPKIMPNYSTLSGWFHCQPEETMLSPSQFWLDGWRSFLNFAMDFADKFVVGDPSHLVIFLKGGFLWISSGFEVILGYFCFSDFGVLELSRDDCWFRQFWCAWILLGSSELSFLVNWPGSNFACLLFFILDLAQSCRACFRFYYIFSFVFVSSGRRAVSLPVLFLAKDKPFLFFSCLI